MKEFNVGGVALGLLASAYFYSYAVMQVPTGLLADTVGPRKTVTFFMGLASIGAFMFALAPNFWATVLGRLLIGLGVAVVWVCTIRILAVWFTLREFATMNGVLNFVGNVGALGAATPLAFLTITFGWRIPFFFIACFTGFLTLVVWALVRDDPKQVGLTLPFNHIEESSSDPTKIGLIQGLKLTFSNKYFWLVGFSLAVWYGTLVNFQGLWGIPYLIQAYGYDKAQASYFITLIALGFCVSAPFWGYISDKVLGARKPVFVGGILTYTFLWLILLATTKVFSSLLLYLIFFMFGFSSGAIIICITMVKELFPEQVVGTAVGCTNLFPFVGVGIFQPLTGYILDLAGPIKIIEGVKFYPTYAYHTAFMFCFLSLIIVSILAFFTKETLKTKD